MTILAHNRLRGAIFSGQIVYLEALPFLIYLAMLLVALNSLLVVLPNRPRIIAYGDNAVPRLLFWPVLLGALIVISLVVLIR